MPRSRRLDPLRRPLAGEPLADVTNRLKTARGHIDHILAQLDDGAYVIDVLRQMAAVRGALDAAARVALRYYFEHAFVNAVKAGQGSLAIDEMMRALTFLRQLD
jgi:CsoR family transcriptional regulator, copper-sensing transcriptional repressor